VSLTSLELRELADDCVHCGFCLPSCPTYVLWGQEADSPRGRIYLMKAALEGRATIDAHFRAHIDSCLGCMSCVTACPSGVQYDRLIEATRPQVEARTKRPLLDRLYRQLLFAVFPQPSRLRIVAVLLRALQRSGIQPRERRHEALAGEARRPRAIDAVRPRH
jgi:glycolate oxidase iron-sulfur subunit